MNEQQPANIHKEKLEAILSNAVDAIVTIDERGVIQSANPATESLFGYAVAELIGQNVRVLMPEPYHSEHNMYLSNYLQSGIKKIIGIGREALGQKKNGTTFSIHVAVSEIRVDGERFFTGIVRDISDVKTVEAKLVQSERLAAIGQMVAGLAHESRNAFQRSHACLANLAFDVKEMPESLELVQKVQNALDHVNALLDEVRNYAAPIVLEKSPTDLKAMIRDTWEQIRLNTPNEINFSIESDVQFPKNVMLDRRRFGQVFWNLLENARVACDASTNEPKIVVALKSKRCSRGNSVYLIEVTDSGIGIEDSNLESVFEPFFTTKTKGTGLGLAICKRIVDSHEGKIALSNHPAGGAMVVIELAAADTK